MTSSDARTNGATKGSSAAVEREPTAALIAVIEDLAGELSLGPLLERILRRSTELLGCDAGSICLVDEAAGVYRKEADIGVACQSGRIFPLDEGVTGAVYAARGLVIFDDYAKVPGGHVREEDRASLKGVIGVPDLVARAHHRLVRHLLPRSETGVHGRGRRAPRAVRQARGHRHHERSSARGGRGERPGRGRNGRA